MAKLLLSSINCFQLHNLFLLFNSNLYVDFNYTFFEFLLLSITQKCAFTIMQIINVLSEIDFKCQHPIILFMKYSNKLMHELFLIHMFSKSINTIVTLLFFNLVTWHLMGAVLQSYHLAAHCTPMSPKSDQPQCRFSCAERSRLNSQSVAHACWWQALIL